jgi:hypothetical protein
MGWHLTQLTVPSLDIRGSQNRIWPNFTFAGVMGFSAEGMEEGSGPNIALACFVSSSSVLAAFTMLAEKATIPKTNSAAKSFRMNLKMSLALIIRIVLEAKSVIVTGLLFFI